MPVTVTVNSSNRIRVGKTIKDGRYAVSVGKSGWRDREAQISVETKKGTVTYAPGTLRYSEVKDYKISWTRSHTVNIKLHQGPEGWIKGKVRQADGKPAGGATVHLYEGSWEPHTEDAEAGRVRTTTADDKGHYAIGSLAPGVYQVFAEDSGSRGVGQSAPRRIVVKAKKVKAPTLSFRKTGTVKVPFTVAPNGGNIAVGLLDELGRLVNSRYVYLDSEQTSGSATFSYVPEGSYRATVIGTGLAADSLVLHGGDVVISETIATPQTTAISGKVVLPDGQGATASLTFLDSNHLASSYYVSSNKGTFSVKGFHPGAHQVSALSHNSVTYGSRKGKLVQRDPVAFNVTAGSPVTDLEIRLEMGGQAKGKIAYPDSKASIKNIRAIATRVVPTGVTELDVVETSIDKKGKYAFDRLVTGVEYHVSFVDGDAVYRTTWYGGKKGKKSPAKSKVIVVDAKSTTKLGATTVRSK